EARHPLAPRVLDRQRHSQLAALPNLWARWRLRRLARGRPAARLRLTLGRRDDLLNDVRRGGDAVPNDRGHRRLAGRRRRQLAPARGRLVDGARDRGAHLGRRADQPTDAFEERVLRHHGWNGWRATTGGQPSSSHGFGVATVAPVSRIVIRRLPATSMSTV